jgi:hypothetical protein
MRSRAPRLSAGRSASCEERGWAPRGIFDDDVACDARFAPYELLRDSQSAEEATDAVLKERGDMAGDKEKGPVVMLALAAAQCGSPCGQTEFQVN